MARLPPNVRQHSMMMDPSGTVKSAMSGRSRQQVGADKDKWRRVIMTRDTCSGQETRGSRPRPRPPRPPAAGRPQLRAVAGRVRQRGLAQHARVARARQPRVRSGVAEPQPGQQAGSSHPAGQGDPQPRPGLQQQRLPQRHRRQVQLPAGRGECSADWRLGFFHLDIDIHRYTQHSNEAFTFENLL